MDTDLFGIYFHVFVQLLLFGDGMAKPIGPQLQLDWRIIKVFFGVFCFFFLFVLMPRIHPQKFLIWLVWGGCLISKQLVVVVFKVPQF